MYLLWEMMILSPIPRSLRNFQCQSSVLCCAVAVLVVLVVRVLAFYSDIQSSNPAGYKNCSKRRNIINEKEAGFGPPLKNKGFVLFCPRQCLFEPVVAPGNTAKVIFCFYLSSPTLNNFRLAGSSPYLTLIWTVRTSSLFCEFI